MFRFLSGSTVGVEGAYFLNPYIGAGGKAGISSASVLRNNEASSLSFDFQSLYAGIYLSYQVLSRLQIGSKLLAGYVRTSPLYLSGSSITKRNTAGLATGCSLKFKAKSGFGMGLFADYEMLPSFLRVGNRHVGHLLTLGGSVGLTF